MTDGAPASIIAAEFDERWNGAKIDEEHWHFHRKLLERYGIVLAPGEFSAMIRLLRAGKAMLVKPRPGGNGIYSYRLPSSGMVIYVVASRHTVYTAYPPSRHIKALRSAVVARAREYGSSAGASVSGELSSPTAAE